MITSSGTLTAQNANPSTGAPTSGSVVQINTNGLQKTVTVQVSGTWTGALTIQETIDGTNWVNNGVVDPITTGTAATTIPSATPGIFQAPINGALAVRVSANAAITGSAVVTMVGTPV